MKKQIETTHTKSIRYPVHLWKELARHAEKNGRTIAGEVIFRLQKSLKQK